MWRRLVFWLSNTCAKCAVIPLNWGGRGSADVEAIKLTVTRSRRRVHQLSFRLLQNGLAQKLLLEKRSGQFQKLAGVGELFQRLGYQIPGLAVVGAQPACAFRDGRNGDIHVASNLRHLVGERHWLSKSALLEV